MTCRMMMEVGVDPQMALRGQRRWLYLECLSTLENPLPAAVCKDLLSPGSQVGSPAMRGGNDLYSWFNW